ncbi:myogenesis-regulating glycosidase [Anabrus simplex]|uniref:myogenesis-regulating glycosidase n=1 Tax=Anabrus simplex TaxID=316456 RepID=UPI0035A32BE8
MQRLGFLCLLLAASLVDGGKFIVTPDREIRVTKRDGSVKFSGKLGVDIKGEGVNCGSEDDGEIYCRRWGDVSISVKTLGTNCVKIKSTGPGSGLIIKDCHNLTGHWYGGPEQMQQYWPTEKETFTDYSYVTKQQDNQGIAEPYWLTSSGEYFYVSPDTPLFIDQNNADNGQFCMVAKNDAPYSKDRENTTLEYTFCSDENPRLAHEDAIKRFLGKPTGIPDERMIRYPIWSTWAQYKANINEEIVTDFANQIVKYGFQNSQLEIDDLWETCYGSLTFDTKKFPDIQALTSLLKSKGFRVTLWIHPFINVDCEPYYSEALENGYLVLDTTGNAESTWWNGKGAVIDFTKPEAARWWLHRLTKLQILADIDSFKFDAGETSWLPQLPVLSGPITLQPGTFTTKYVETVSQFFGSMIEVRVGQRTQHLPNFVRMLDKDSRWDFKNGLPTLITTLLQMNMVGYTIVLPDMVGGNGYGSDVVTKELFIRWLEANVFMPSIQFSYVPWDFDEETIQISKKFSELHANYTDKIIAVMQKSVEDGSPVNPPVWWIDPEDTEAQGIDDEFLLGEDLLVAPVIKEGAVSRDIYLPAGSWKDELRPDQPLIEGRTWLRDYPAALDELPYFTKVK